MTLSVEYPLNISLGSVVLESEVRSIAQSRAKLFIDVKQNTRKMLPEYGNTLRLFDSTESSPQIEATLLEFQLNQFCTQSAVDMEFNLTYQVVASLSNTDMLNLQIEIN